MNPYCPICSRSVGEGYQVDGRLVHPGCFLCADCGRTIEERYVRHWGVYYHPICYQKRTAPRCRVCGGVIAGRYVTQSGRAYHRECFRDHVAPRCTGCGKPLMGTYVAASEGPFHPSCHARRIGLRCSITGRAIGGKYYEDDWGHVYSERAYSSYPPCAYCGRLLHRRVSGRGAVYPDGRAVCGVCRKSVLSSRSERQQVEEVRGRLRDQGIYVSLNRIPVEFVDRRQMKKVLRLRHQRHERSGLFSHPRDWQQGGESRVRILSGMPQEYLEGTLAHELFHVWQWQNCRQEPAAYLCEGSANYAASLVHLQGSSDYSRYLLRRLENHPHPHYGAGFRRVRKFVDEQELPALLARMERFKTLPRGY